MKTQLLTSFREQRSFGFYCRYQLISGMFKTIAKIIKPFRVKIVRFFSFKALHKCKYKKVGGKLLPYYKYYGFNKFSHLRIWIKNKSLKGIVPSPDIYEIEKDVKIQNIPFAIILSGAGYIYQIPAELLTKPGIIKFVESQTNKKIEKAHAKHINFIINGFERERTIWKLYFSGDDNPYYYHVRTSKLSKQKHLGRITNEYNGIRTIRTTEGSVHVTITPEHDIPATNKKGKAIIITIPENIKYTIKK